MARSAILNVMVQAAMKAGRSLARDFGEVQNLQVSMKGPGDFVSQADRKAEEIIRTELPKARPRYAFLMEESGAVAGADGQHRWIVDPLDGTTNFLHGIPLFAISIALERQGETRRRRHLQSGDGRALHRRARRRRLSQRPPPARRRPSAALPTASSAAGVPHLGRGHHGNFLVELRNVMAEVSGMRRLGAAALDLAYVAAGRLDGFWERGLSPWDMAAGILMIREAGGFVTDTNGGAKIFEIGFDLCRQRGDPFPAVVSARPRRHGKVMKAVQTTIGWGRYCNGRGN